MDASAGRLVLQEGQAGDELCVILHGQVQIMRVLGS